MLFFSSILSFSLLVSTAIAANRHPSHAFERLKKHKRDASRQPSQPVLPKHHAGYHSKSPFLNSATRKFAVDPNGIPDVPFNIGESYAGLLPISDKANETSELYFWFFPSSNPAAKDEITIWFNGGPGCSSLSGLLTENGPFLWQAGTISPTPNSYSWTNLTNMVWVEQPVGVGFSQGTPDIYNEVELAEQFAGFWKNFIKTFSMEGYKMYITGESYGGYYVPYVAQEFIKQDDCEYFNLSGVAINDPIIGDGTIQQDVVIVPYVDYWSNLFYLNQSFSDALHERHESCGYAAYYEKYFKFPPPDGPFPVLPDPYADPNYTCDIFDDVYEAAWLVNPCFNIYHITDTCPHLWSVMGIVNPGDYSPPGLEVYFNRTDVQRAINAPVGTNWMQCTDINVFGGPSDNQSLSDTSLAPAQNDVLKRVIEHTNNTIIGVGNLDFLLAPNGTLLALQNVTWHGVQGFQEYPSAKFYTPYHPEYNGGRLSESGDVGLWREERGLTFYQVQLSGHELPGYAAGSGYRVLEKLLGRIPDLSYTGDFTTQHGNFTGTSTIYKKRSEL